MRALLRMASLLWLMGMTAACNPCDPGEIEELFPRLETDPTAEEGANVARAPVAGDSLIPITISNPSTVPLYIYELELTEDSDPAFRLTEFEVEKRTITPREEGEEREVWIVEPRASEVLNVIVRPILTGDIEAKLRILAEPGALPEPEVIIPLSASAADLGLPDITVDPTEVAFDQIGQNDVVRATVNISNDGVRDLIIDETSIIPSEEDGEDSPIRMAIPIPPGYALAPQETVSVDLVFAPLDTIDHTAILRIISNDPDELQVDVPVSGRGSLCPSALAELLEDPEDLEPLDTVRLDGQGSTIGTPGTELVSYEWQLEQRPVGSTSVLFSPNSDRTEMTCDIAGDYQVRLTVYDSDGIRSCEDSVVRFTCKPTEDLHLQLVWDHPAADFDLHLLKEGGLPFTHEGDTYFSNREPEWFPDNPESNPSLDVDDDEGYGPENINIETPIPGSKWTVLVHYWNKQTDGDPFAVATLRLYAFGQQVLDLNKSFEEDETLWTAVEIEWGMEEGELPSVTQLGQCEEYPRPF